MLFREICCCYYTSNYSNFYLPLWTYLYFDHTQFCISVSFLYERRQYCLLMGPWAHQWLLFFTKRTTWRYKAEWDTWDGSLAYCRALWSTMEELRRNIQTWRPQVLLQWYGGHGLCKHRHEHPSNHQQIHKHSSATASNPFSISQSSRHMAKHLTTVVMI